MTAALKMAGWTSPEGKLAELKATRTELLGWVAGLGAARQRLDAAQNDERAATAALGELGAAEVAAMSAWAGQGAVGAAPKPGLTRRAELAISLSAAQAASAAARGAGARLDAELAGLRAEIAAIEADIETAALACLEVERHAAFGELEKAAARARHLIAKLQAHRFSLGQLGRDRSGAGQPDAARPLFQEAERLAGLPLPDPSPSAGDIDLARREWLQRFGGLKA